VTELRLTFCEVNLFAFGPPPFCATGGLVEGLGGPENACAAAATRPGFNACAWSLLPAAVVVEFPVPPGLALAWFIPAVSKREAAAGFFAIARWAAEATAAPDALPLLPAAAPAAAPAVDEFPDPAWLIPATSKRDAAAGFFVIARWAAPAAMAAPDPDDA
jgi:hypothetical protein